MMDSIKNFAESGGKIYAECGGFMYLTEGIVDFDGKFHRMAGIFPTKAKMLKRRKALGYVEVEAVGDSPLAAKGSRIRGHEFHYSEIDEMPETIKRVYRVNKRGSEGALPSKINFIEEKKVTTQIEFARQGIITKEMTAVAHGEGLADEYV